MKLYNLLVPILFITFNLQAQVNNNIAQTPPMGWNSYNCFGSAVHENEVKENADYTLLSIFYGRSIIPHIAMLDFHTNRV
jgi:hypothetical protein